MGTKTTTGFVDNFSLHTEGLWLIISYRGKELERKNLKAYNLGFKDLEVYLGENEGKTSIEETEGTEIAVSQSEVIKFAQVFQGLQKKYTGRMATYIPPKKGAKPATAKNWTALTAAAAQAKKLEMMPHEYLELLIRYYTRRAEREGGQVAFPYPSQLSGEWATQVIINETGRKNAKHIPADVKASRIAATNRYLALEKDQAYTEAYQRVKDHRATEFDIEYIKARHIQLYGEPKDWILREEKVVKEQASKEAASGKE